MLDDEEEEPRQRSCQGRTRTRQVRILALSVAICFVVILAGERAALVGATYSSTSSSIALFDGQPTTASTSGGANNQHHDQPHQQRVSHKSPLNSRQFGDSINDIQIECNSDNIVVTLTTNQGFNGMIYPKGLSKNSSCMVEYHQMSSNITYYLPLKSCNTMSSDVEDGVEYFNTVMVQPHRRLVTNQGRGYHIRCRYQTKERTITNQDQQLSVNLTQITPAVVGSAAMPSCTMRIYGANDLSREVAAENVRIGDELHLMIALDDQDVYGMLVTNCLVRDGMNWGEQPLIDDNGCPVDEEIMPQFSYASNLTRASVTFQAHKFPYTSSVYYQCNVRLCFRENGCSHVPPNCSGQAPASRSSLNSNYKQQTAMATNSQQSNSNRLQNFRSLEDGSNELQEQQSGGRHRRWIDGGELDGVASEEVLLNRPGRQASEASSNRAMSIEVSSGLLVDESEALKDKPAAAPETEANSDPIMMASTNDDPQETSSSSASSSSSSSGKQTESRQQSDREFCMSLRKFAIAISLASLLLMTAIIIMIACMIQRRKRERMEAQMQNSAYDYHQESPYANRAYCRD